MKAYHKKYGFGEIIEDICGDCKENEVLFKPDNGIFDRTNIGGERVLFSPSKFDIFDKSELKIFD